MFWNDLRKLGTELLLICTERSQLRWSRWLHYTSPLKLSGAKRRCTGNFFLIFLWTTQDRKKRCEGKEEKEVKKGQWILYSVVVPKQRACNLIQVKSREDIFHQLQCKCNLKAGTSTCTGTYYEQWSLYVVVVVVVVMRNFLFWNIPETRSKTSANVVEIGRWRVRYLWPAPYMGCWIMWLVALIRPLYNWGGGKEKRKHHNQVSCRN